MRRWTPSRAARAILSFQPVLERIQYLYFIIFWKKEWKLNRNIGSSKLNSPLSFFLFSLLSSFPFPFSFSLFFFCIRAPPAPKICRRGRQTNVFICLGFRSERRIPVLVPGLLGKQREGVWGPFGPLAFCLRETTRLHVATNRHFRLTSPRVSADFLRVSYSCKQFHSHPPTPISYVAGTNSADHPRVGYTRGYGSVGPEKEFANQIANLGFLF